MEGLNFVTMPFIILVVYLITQVLKIAVLKSDESKKLLPPIAGIMGGIIGVAVFFVAPEAASFTNVIDACTSGIASGLAAVGANQVYKQLTKTNTATTSEENTASE